MCEEGEGGGVGSVRKGRAGQNAPSSVTRKPFISPARRTVPPWAVGYCMAGEEWATSWGKIGLGSYLMPFPCVCLPTRTADGLLLACAERDRQSVSTGPMAAFMTGSHGHSTPSSQLPSEVCPARRTHTSSGGMGPRRSDVFARPFVRSHLPRRRE
jgi:hypothetical protein